MERKEPTLSGSANNAGANNDRDESTYRRQAAAYDDNHSNRNSGRNIETYTAAPSSSSLPLIALLVAIVGVLGGGFLGFELMDANATIVKDAGRIQKLEDQLNITSNESTQSVAALGINLQKVDADLKKLQDTVRKLNSEHNEKLVSLGKSIDATKADINNVKKDVMSVKEDVLVHKASLDEMSSRIDNLDKNIAEQRKKIADANASINTIASQLKSAAALAARITKTEEAIDAIDDNRRTNNKDLLQIKQQLGIKN